MLIKAFIYLFILRGRFWGKVNLLLSRLASYVSGFSKSNAMFLKWILEESRTPYFSCKLCVSHLEKFGSYCSECIEHLSFLALSVLLLFICFSTSVTRIPQKSIKHCMDNRKTLPVNIVQYAPKHFLKYAIAHI